MSRTLLAVAFSLAIVGCAGTGSVTGSTEEPASTALRGHYYWGHEVRTFHPCGSERAFWVVGDAALLQPLRDEAMDASQASGKPYTPIYVEASGVMEGKATDGFATDYDGVYRFTAVQSSSRSSPADCPVRD